MLLAFQNPPPSIYSSLIVAALILQESITILTFIIIVSLLLLFHATINDIVLFSFCVLLVSLKIFFVRVIHDVYSGCFPSCIQFHCINVPYFILPSTLDGFWG